MIIAILVSFLIVFVTFRKIEIKQYEPVGKLVIPFYRLSAFIVEASFKSKSGFLKRRILKSQVVDSLKQINPTDRSYYHIKKYYVEKIATSFMVIFAGSILAFIAIISQRDSRIIIEDKYLERGTFTQGSNTQKLTVSVEDELLNQEVLIKIDEQQLTKAQVFKMFDKTKEWIDSQILGKNTSLMEVRNNLKLPSFMEGVPVKINWETDNYEVLGSNGEVNNEEINEEGVVVNLTVILTYQSDTKSYDIQVKVLPPLLSKTDILLKEILEKVQIANQDGVTSQYLELPQDINGKLIDWGENKTNPGRSVLIIGIIASIVIYCGKDKNLEGKVKKREKELLLDYPNIVSKLTLLLGAGMTVKNAWQKIALDYREKKEKDLKYYRYAYEEMLIAYYELVGGVSEVKVYENFGKRTKNQRYIKLTALITQNLRKGSRGLSEILENESKEAFEERKAYAKIIGEEASTKLMLPMFLNLILVLIMIMIPACMSFQM